eukprot:TRINITY_DN8345_c0_g1_i2.p1 TRINITY_DN8345_c0_g1~~TRINITY_DN8345_c0_g1_i2.p1  ORF type:complete len:198 (+),score=43.22 TRINITY_DN8345_c0_g1_i2:66-659(+)
MLHTFPISFRKELEQKNEGYVTEYLRKKKTSLDEEKKQWTDKYDQEMAQKVGQINQLKQRLDGIKELRTVAEHKYEDYARRIEAIRGHRYRQKMLVLFEKAATVIQAAWRGYSVRKMLPVAFRRRFLRKREKKIEQHTPQNPSPLQLVSSIVQQDLSSFPPLPEMPNAKKPDSAKGKQLAAQGSRPPTQQQRKNIIF